MTLIIIILLILLLTGLIPLWPHAAGWGYGPSGFVAVLLVVVIILYLTGHI